MRLIHTSLVLGLFILGLFACTDHLDRLTPADTCKLTAIDRGNNNKHSYTYDAQGRISQMTREFDGNGSGTISQFVYAFTFDGAGLLTKSVITLDGKPYGTETYTYTNGRLSKTAYVNADGSKGTNNIQYDATGQITEFTFETGDPAADGKQYFEYNTDGVMTKRGFADLQGTVFFEIRMKPVGKVTSPEQLLTKRGLPYDLLTGFSWSIAVGGVGSTDEVFVLDDKTGKLVSIATDKTTAIKTNAKGYVTETTSVDDTDASSTQTFTLTDCN